MPLGTRSGWNCRRSSAPRPPVRQNVVMPRRRADFRGLLESNRVRLLGAIQAEGGRTLRELADQTGIPLNTAREHLWALEAEGLVTSTPLETGKRGRPPLVYDAVTDVDENQVARKRIVRVADRRERLRRALRLPTDTPAAAVEGQLDVLYEHLEDMGLAPTVLPDGLMIETSPGAHKDLYKEYEDLVCDVHSRLIEDTLTLAQGPLALAEVRPFVGPDECLVVLYLKEVAPEGTVIKDCSERIKPV